MNAPDGRGIGDMEQGLADLRHHALAARPVDRFIDRSSRRDAHKGRTKATRPQAPERQTR